MDECENFLEIILFSLPRALIDTERAFPRQPNAVQMSAIQQALEFQQLLDEKVVNSQAEIAERYGISRARVTQVLNILRLSRSALIILQDVDTHGPSPCTERRLREILRLPTQNAQLVFRPRNN